MSLHRLFPPAAALRAPLAPTGLLLALALAVLTCAPAFAAQDESGKPLSLEQIKRLIQNDFPDTALAGEIRDRGIDFSSTFDRKTIETLRALGAQEKTLRALEPYLPKAAVRVVAKLDRSIVLIDGKQYGTTDTTGILQINDLEPGEHVIEVRNRPRYKDAQARVVLGPRDNQDVIFEPELNVGSLTITPLTPNLEVVVYNELASLTGSFARREMAPGIYTLQAKSRWHRPITQIIQIKSGQNLTLPIELELDEELIEDTLFEAQKAFSSKDYTKSANILLEVLSIAPKNLPALSLLAQAYLRLNDTPNFTAAAKRALDADGALDFALLLHSEKKAPQPVRLRLSRTSLTLEFLESGETQTLPLEAFSRAFIRGDVQGEIFLVIAGARSPKRLPDLQFSLANSYDPRDGGGEGQLSQRDKINLLWNIEEIVRFSIEVRREFLAVAAGSATGSATGSRATPKTEDRPARRAEAPPAAADASVADALPANASPANASPAPARPDKAPEKSKPEKSRRDEDKKRAEKDAKQKKGGQPPEPAPLADQVASAPSPGAGAASDSPPPSAASQPGGKKPEKSKKSQDIPLTPAAAVRAAAASPAPPGDEIPKGAPSPVRARALIGTMIGASGGRAMIERIAAMQFYGAQTTVEPSLATPESAPDPKPIRQLWARGGKFRLEISPGNPTGLVFVRNEKAYWQRANGRVERITQPETLKQVRLQSKLAGVGLYQQLLLPAKELARFSRYLDGQVEETIRVTDADGDTYDVVIDLETRRPRKCAYQLPTDIGQPLQIEERYEDFRLVNDVWLPHRIVRSVQGGRVVTLTFTDIQFLPALGDEAFRRP
ncbi:MAG: hypothetical protein CFK52_13060 [Chloracidobacterium sp. CP2_5A]|nr:MAG: hypothetical protein CFK52_13060 [Chloracidobacterium sp. CP2_5A]